MSDFRVDPAPGSSIAATSSTVKGLQPLQFSPQTQTVTIDDVVIQLTAQETCILDYLFAKRGQGLLCRREDLRTAIWEDRVALAAVGRAVTRLRKKLEPDPQRPQYIHSVRGHGYFLMVG